MYQAAQTTNFYPASSSVAYVLSHTAVQSERSDVSGVNVVSEAPQDRLSGEYPAFSVVTRAAQAERGAGARATKLRPSLLRAIHTGYEVYLALPEEEREAIHGRGRKLQSCRKLASSAQMAVSTLWRALATYMLYRRHPEIAEYVHLGVGHVSVVLSVEEEYQLYFLRNAEIGRWSRRRLDDEVKFYHSYRAQHSQARALNGVV